MYGNQIKIFPGDACRPAISLLTVPALKHLSLSVYPSLSLPNHSLYLLLSRQLLRVGVIILSAIITVVVERWGRSSSDGGQGCLPLMTREREEIVRHEKNENNIQGEGGLYRDNGQELQREARIILSREKDKNKVRFIMS